MEGIKRKKHEHGLFTFTSGKYKYRDFKDIYENEPKYVVWLQRQCLYKFNMDKKLFEKYCELMKDEESRGAFHQNVIAE